MVVAVDTVVAVEADVLAYDDEEADAATAAGAELELSPRATNNAAPTTPIATAVPTDIPPDADPALPCCALTPTGDTAISIDTTVANILFFIIFNLMFSILFLPLTAIYVILTTEAHYNNILQNNCNFFLLKIIS